MCVCVSTGNAHLKIHQALKINHRVDRRDIGRPQEGWGAGCVGRRGPSTCFWCILGWRGVGGVCMTKKKRAFLLFSCLQRLFDFWLTLRAAAPEQGSRGEDSPTAQPGFRTPWPGSDRKSHPLCGSTVEVQLWRFER